MMVQGKSRPLESQPLNEGEQSLARGGAKDAMEVVRRKGRDARHELE